MPEWLVERGIGETRAVLVEAGEIIEARIELEGTAAAGSLAPAWLKDVGMSGRNAVAISASGAEYLLPGGAAGVPQGAALTIEVTREAIPGSEPWKRPLARIADQPLTVPTSLAERLGSREIAFPEASDRLAALGWNDLLEEARSGIVSFAGGELRISPTPAMTLIDIDGHLPARELALTGAEAAARSIRRLDIGGSIGLDLPTISGKADRQAIGDRIDGILQRPFERTAMNGFGFVQIVRPRRRPSLVELALDYASFEARALLRRAAFEPAGGKCLVAHPALIGAIEARPDWLEQLARQVGGQVRLRADRNLPMSAGYAEQA